MKKNVKLPDTVNVKSSDTKYGPSELTVQWMVQISGNAQFAREEIETHTPTPSKLQNHRALIVASPEVWFGHDEVSLAGHCDFGLEEWLRWFSMCPTT